MWLPDCTDTIDLEYFSKFQMCGYPLETTGGFQEPINGVSGQALMGLWWRVQCSVSVFCNCKYSNRHTSIHFIQVLPDITVHMHLYKEVGVEKEKE